MARSKATEEVNVEVAKETQDVSSVKVADAKVTIVADAKPKLIEVRFLKDGQSRIAAETYAYHKDHTAKVPADVAAILANSGVAIKL